MSYSQSVARIVEDLTDSYELIADDLPVADVIPLCPTGPRPKPASLQECLPILAIALEFIDRGPQSLSVDAVETYRVRAKRLLEHLRPAIETGAHMTLEDWVQTITPRQDIRHAA